MIIANSTFYPQYGFRIDPLSLERLRLRKGKEQIGDAINRAIREYLERVDPQPAPIDVAPDSEPAPEVPAPSKFVVRGNIPGREAMRIVAAYKSGIITNEEKYRRLSEWDPMPPDVATGSEYDAGAPWPLVRDSFGVAPVLPVVPPPFDVAAALE